MYKIVAVCAHKDIILCIAETFITYSPTLLGKCWFVCICVHMRIFIWK